MKKTNSKGFTLIEFMIASTIFGFTVVFSINTYVLLSRNLINSSDKRAVQTEVRNISDSVIRFVGEAAYVELEDPVEKNRNCASAASVANLSAVRIYSKDQVNNPVFIGAPYRRIVMLSPVALQLYEGNSLTNGQLTDYRVEAFRACLNKTNPQTINFFIDISAPNDNNRFRLEQSRASLSFTAVVGGGSG
jgi:prepilin-type N-terminal cleavage/methylation domain-containing protein